MLSQSSLQPPERRKTVPYFVLFLSTVAMVAPFLCRRSVEERTWLVAERTAAEEPDLRPDLPALELVGRRQVDAQRLVLVEQRPDLVVVEVQLGLRVVTLSD